ncbi:MAG: FliA/WhiG family RNA polymerase sigma factor [Clostridiales bacterium]|nr:FliA/WhiG family RNA polymerase sigma factor [Clostridiales bacterium]
MASNGRNTINEIKVAEPEELMRLYKATGDVELRNQLVMHYVQFVNVAIYSMRSILLSNIPFEDFFNQGVLALIECIERYDPSRGASFDTYSYLGIRGSILKYLRKQNWLPNRVWEARKRITQGRSELEQTLMREPTDRELADYLGMSEKQLEGLISEMSVIDTVSFEELLESTYANATESSCYAEETDISEKILHEELIDALASAIDALPPKQKQVISLYYYENLNLREIGEVIGVSQQRVSQIRAKALENLSDAIKKFENGGKKK